MSDDQIGKLLREALSPTQDHAARRDVWPSLIERLNDKPRWSLVDVGLGVAAAVSLLSFPEGLWLLVHHL